MLFNSGPAVYTDDIATRDVHKLRKVENKNRKTLVLVFVLALGFKACFAIV